MTIVSKPPSKPGRGGGKEKRGKVDDIAVYLSTNSEKGDGNAIKGKGPLRGMFPPVLGQISMGWANKGLQRMS